MITQTLKLNLIPGQVLPRVNVSQYDAGTRTLQMLLYNGDQAFNISAGLGGFVQGTKPDRTGFQYAATVTEGSNVVTLVITQQMTAVSGEVTCELVISNGNDRIATVNFILYVEPAALADDTVISETELPLIEEAAELAQRIDGIAADVEADADRAEAAVEHYPYIGANGNWYVFDLQTEQFVDTTIAATGPQGPTGPTGPTGPQGPTGPTGNGIVSITKTGTSGLVDTYTITFTDGTTTTFTVTNGQDGQGSGDMTKAVYDSTNAVADAGGIVAYVAAHSGAGTLAGLDDVTLSSLAAGDTLVYNATTQKWENSTVIQTLTNQVATKADSSTVTALANDVDNISDEIADMNNVLGAKNLLPNKAVSQTLYGVTFTKNNDGSLTVNGTATEGFNFNLNSDKDWIKTGLDFIFTTGIPYDIDAANLTIAIIETSGGSTEYILAGDTFKFNSVPYSCIVSLWCPSGQTYNNVTFKPMVRLASIEDDTYVPYSMTNREMTPYVQAISNPNLLDNPWFTVNQRGQSSYSQAAIGSSYTIDRWKLYCEQTGSSAQLDVNSDESITLSGNKPLFIQFIEPKELKKLAGKTMTVSVFRGDGSVDIGTKTLPNPLPTSSFSTLGAFISNSDYTLSATSGRESVQSEWEIIRLQCHSANASLTIKAIKLELGSVSTLAQDTAPNYATELLKCQRYFVRYISPDFFEGYTYDATTARFGLVLPVPMRTNPSFSVDDITHLQVIGNGNGQALTTSQTISNSGFGTNKKVMEISGLATALSANIPVFVKLNSGYIDLSADL